MMMPLPEAIIDFPIDSDYFINLPIRVEGGLIGNPLGDSGPILV